jgi:Uma2 family endonuclease
VTVQRRRSFAEQGYSVADYLCWPDDIRCELIGGVIYDMSPAPVIGHQRLLLGLSFDLESILRRRSKGGEGCGTCELLVAPIDVVLSPNSVVQPDLIVVCDPAKLANGKYVDGAPDLVVEVLSPSTALKDKREKRRLYEQAGVLEYLILDPAEFYAEYYRLEQGAYGLPAIWGSADRLALLRFPELTATLGELFGWPAVDTTVGRPLSLAVSSAQE